MTIIIACLMAGLCFLVNQILLRFIGSAAIVSYGPMLEEIFKTLPAAYFGANLLAVHVIFGLLEAFYDWFGQKHSVQGLAAALSSIVGHSSFGMITVSGYHWSGNIWVGLSGAMLGHLLWNASVIRMNK